jgi:hypothetical protein
MTAFRASYADWRVIKTRACIQVVFEVPIEQADQAYQVLGGMPMAANEIWCAVARLDERKVSANRPGQAIQNASAGSDNATPRPDQCVKTLNLKR